MENQSENMENHIIEKSGNHQIHQIFNQKIVPLLHQLQPASPFDPTARGFEPQRVSDSGLARAKSQSLHGGSCQETTWAPPGFNGWSGFQLKNGG